MNTFETNSVVPGDIRRVRMLDVVRERDYVKVADLADLCWGIAGGFGPSPDQLTSGA